VLTKSVQKSEAQPPVWFPNKNHFPKLFSPAFARTAKPLPHTPAFFGDILQVLREHIATESVDHINMKNVELRMKR
jgi:hypothetical protein